MEHDNIVNTIDKFRFKTALYFLHDTRFHLLVILCLTLLRGKSQILGIHNSLCSGIGGHDQYGIFKADFPPLGIRNVTVIQYLQQDIEHIGMCLFDLIE